MFCNIFLTTRCNLKCSYCYVDKQTNMDLDPCLIENIILFIRKILKDNNDKEIMINFFGGEPLLKLDLIKTIVEKIKKENLKYYKFILTTNGTLMTEEVVDYLKAEHFSLSLSIDGIPEVHNRYRIFHNDSPSWPVIEQKIPYMLHKIPNIIARLTFNSVTCENLAESVEFVIDKGFQVVKVVPDYFDESWTEERFSILESQIRLIKKRKSKGKYENIIISLLDNTPQLYGTCDGGASSFVIDVRGDIYPCSYVVGNPEFKIGTIREWEKYQKHCYSVADDERDACTDCRYYKCCTSGRCLFVNYKMTQRFGEPNGFFCAFQRLLYSI